MTLVEQTTKLVNMNWIKSKLSTKQKQYSNKRQTSIEVKVGKLLSVFFISIFDNFNNVLKRTGIVI